MTTDQKDIPTGPGHEKPEAPDSNDFAAFGQFLTDFKVEMKGFFHSSVEDIRKLSFENAALINNVRDEIKTLIGELQLLREQIQSLSTAHEEHVRQLNVTNRQVGVIKIKVEQIEDRVGRLEKKVAGG